MGFDIECIIDIHTYPGEYFCPVCRTLVYPSEALQSQCTHLYCKPCLAHVANSTRACPYDGYLVTEADSKPLLESDKSLAENIGKVKVRCLYHRSGCTWEGQLSECPSHCSSCAFGNSPVICNRCGVQIIHRQVHDHAQNCPGVYQVQQAPDAAQDASGAVSIGAAVAVNQNQPGLPSGAQTLQAQVSQSPSVPLVSSQQPNASSQASAGVPAAVPTQEQWYQQQYQQYYQQYAGYAAYQQVYQLYNPYQQSAVQQHQPHVLVQPQQQPYAQAAVQVPVQSQPQTQVPPQPQPQPQAHVHAQAQPQLQLLNQPQSQPGQPVAIQTHHQILPQGQPQATTYIQPTTLQNQIQPQFHPQKQSHPAMPSHGAPLQSTLAHGFPTPSQQYNQSQPNVIQPQQHVQALQYQQPQLTIQNSKPHSTIPQAQAQVQPQPQPQAQAQVQPQPHAQILPQRHPQNQTPSQPGHPVSFNAPPHSWHTSLHPFSGHQSYPQAQLSQHGQSGVLQQQSFHACPTSAPLPPGQMQGQVSQQPALMVPTSSHGPMPSQHAPFASQVQVPGMSPAQQQQFHSQVPQMRVPLPQHPLMNPNQQPPHQHVQQQPLPSTGQSQLPQPIPFTNQKGMQPQLRPQGPPNLMQLTSHGYFQSQQNAMVAPNLQHQQHNTYIGRPMMPTQGAPIHPSPFAPSSGGYGQASQIRPGPPGSQQLLTMAQNFGNNMVSDQKIAQYGTTGQLQKPIEVVSGKVPAIKEPGDPSKSSAERVGSAPITDSVGVKAPSSEAGISNQLESTGGNTDDIKQEETFVEVDESEFQGGKEDAGEPVNVRRLKEEAMNDPLKPPPNGISFEAPKLDIRDTPTEELEAQKNEKGVILNAAGESLRSTSGLDEGHHNKPDCLEKNIHGLGSQTAANGRDSLNVGRHDQPFHSYGAFMNQQRPTDPGILQSLPPFGAPPGPPTQVRPEGFGTLPQPSSNLGEQFPTPLLKQPHDVSHGGFPGPGSMPSLSRGPGHLGTGHAPPLTNVNQRDGIMGRGPRYLSEDQFLLPNSGGPSGQRVNPFNEAQPKLSGPPLGVESNTFRIHGGQGDDPSSVRSHDERLRSLHEPINSFSKEWLLDQGPKALDGVHAFNYDTDARFGAVSGGPPSNFPPFNGSGSFGLNNPQERDLAVSARDSFRGRMDPNGPGGGYLGHATHGFASNSHSNSGRSGRDDFDGRDMRTIGYLDRTELGGPEVPRFGDHVPTGQSANHFKRPDFVGQDIPPGSYPRFDHVGHENSPNRLRFGDCVGPFSGHARVDPHGPGNIHHSIHFGDSLIGSKAGLHFGEPGFRSRFSREGRRDGHYTDDMDPFDRSRKRQPFSMGWCRICEVDCETVEVLDMHSQTREHQKMAMDLVKAIRQQNKKKQRLSNARAVREEANKARKVGIEGRGGAKPGVLVK